MSTPVFTTESGKGDFADTNLTEIMIGKMLDT